MKNIFLSLFLAWFSCLSAQVATINGIIINKADNQPIPYCSIGIAGTYKGTVCNENGEFVLNTNSNETLIFSIIGFENKTVSVQSLLIPKENAVIYLEPKSYKLKDVSVLAITPLEIIRNAIKNIKSNYPVTPSTLSGFYRETCNDNNKYTRLVEAAINIYDPGYITRKNRQNETTKLIAVRSSYNLSPIFKGLHYNGVSELFNRNLVKYIGDFLNEENFANYNYTIDSIALLNEEPVYVISFNPNERLEKVLSEGTMFIRKKDYAILEIDYGVKKNAKYWTENRFNDSLKWNTNYIEVSLHFTEHNNLLFINYISKKYENIYYKDQKENPSYTSTTFSELMINDIKENVKTTDNGVDMNIKKDIFDQKTTYDPLFWNNYNVLKATALQENIRKDLEQQKTLEQQYTTPSQETSKAEKKQ